MYGPNAAREIVVRALVEINLVAYIEPHTDRTNMSFQSAARVQRSHHVL
jgi:hypothetical protein